MRVVGGTLDRPVNGQIICDTVRVWAKLMMVVESMVSLALAALVIARAINIL